MASSTTAPSTQPPETEPSNRPSPSTTIWLPTGRGDEPHVAITVARATSFPFRIHSRALSIMPFPPRCSSCTFIYCV